MAKIKVNTDNIKSAAKSLRAGDEVLLTGYIYTARDAAHKRIAQLIEEGKATPFEIDGAAVYYAGPTPAKAGMPIGSCGPTTSSRMDVFTPLLLDNGLCAMIGKGQRSDTVVDSIKKNKALYFCAIGGAGALCAMSVKKLEVIAFEELGCESVKKLTVEEFPVICTIDCTGGNMFERK